jgi:hypothetical protein
MREKVEENSFVLLGFATFTLLYSDKKGGEVDEQKELASR